MSTPPIVLDASHDARRRSWVASANGKTDFPIQNLPFGVFRQPGGVPHGGVAIGDRILDLAAAVRAGLVTGNAAEAAAEPQLNAFLQGGNAPATALRLQLSELLSTAASEAQREAALRCLVASDDVELLLPVTIGAFSDFLCSVDHTLRMGRGALPPPFAHIPIAYSSRSSSVRVSGTDVRRPNGSFRDGAGEVVFGPEPSLDFELELGMFVGPGNALGAPVAIGAAADHAFGYCLLNDWSARGIQFFESTPLGPFLGKSFATTISPWIVTAGALAPFRVPARPRTDGELMAPGHLCDDADQRYGGFDIALEAFLSTSAMRAAGAPAQRVTTTNFQTMYWTFAQMLAHHTSNGCDVHAGDLLGSGTTSGPTDESRACLAERTAYGSQSLELPGGEQRMWLRDGDEVILRGRAERGGFVPIGFGECRAIIAPAPALPQSSH